MKLSEFDYSLPKELIAQYPTQRRDESRLLVLHRDTGEIEHRIFRDIVEYFSKDDLLVLNDTKVVPARLFGRKETGGRVEVLVLDSRCSILDARKNIREVLLKPARGCKVGSRLNFGNGELKAEVSRIENGRRFLEFECNGNFEELLDRLGQMPLPPYIKRKVVNSDKERYQTVYASKKGAVAAPTAGLHFTKDILSRITEKEVEVDYLTLHVGYGTFKPVKCENLKKYQMEKEYFEVENKFVEKIRHRSNRVMAVGTTSCRVLETVSRLTLEPSLKSKSLKGWTDLFIYPPYKFKTVDALLTNFHLPRTTLLMLVAAFCGRDLMFKAYREAIKEKNRFYSYGDAMLIV